MGKTSSSVVSSTAGVIAFTGATITSKISAARQFNVPVYTREEFRARIIESG